MTHDDLVRELRRAQVMICVEPERESFWHGYARGLRRGFYRELFGTEAEHRAWIGAAEETRDLGRRACGQGYLAGLARVTPA